VTVGTTRFDLLVKSVTQSPSLEWMASNGYTDLVIQYGKGNAPVLPGDDDTATPDSSTATNLYMQTTTVKLNKNTISCRWYQFQPSLIQDMKNADLIISHAGAGTVMEVLRLSPPKKLVVVINTLLMNNHQTELAHAMAQRGHLFVVNEPTEMMTANEHELIDFWNQFQDFVPIPHQGGDDQDFPQLLNDHLGF